MKVYTLRQIHHEIEEERYLCFQSSSRSGEACYTFDFQTLEELKESEFHLYTTFHPEEFRKKLIPT